MPPPSRDWSNLPPELLDTISRKIVLIADFLRFRAVCPSWRSASAQRPLHLPPQPPWLLLPFDPSPSNPDSARFFFSPLPPQIHRLHLPDTRGLSCRGSSRGCLVLQAGDGPAVCLLNPITQTLIHLPPLSDMTFFSPPRPYPPGRNYRRSQEYVIKKAVLSSNPFTDPQFVVLLLVGFGEFLVFFRGGDASWTVADVQQLDEQRFVDVAYQDRKFFAVGNRGRVTVYDLASPSPSKDVVDSVLLFGEDQKYLVERASGELLVVAWDFRRYASSDRAEYRVFKLSLDGQPQWLEVSDVGEEALLLGGNESHSHCLSICCAAYSGLWRGNCLYYAFPHFVQRVEDGDLGSYGINLFRLEDGGIEQVVRNLGVCSLNWPPPLWFTPSLC